MDNTSKLVIFLLDTRKYALHLSRVRRVVHAVDITPLPGAPDAVLGAITVGGQVLPVYDIRKRFGLETKDISLTDHFIIADTKTTTVVLIADEVIGTVECDEKVPAGKKGLLPESKYAESIITLEGDIVYIHDLDSFLSPDEEQTLKKALQKR
ncbi:MAG: purine-binding chemotaxis protein CheW [Spirochaetes bacterium]|nr:purine-binding chemotaxis protein CheW [Spirochaetota bacterium]